MQRRTPPGAFQVGQRVVIVTGALRGMTGQIVQRDADDRVHLSLGEASPGALVRIHVRHVRHEPSSEGPSGELPETPRSS